MFKPVSLLTTDLHLSERLEDQYRFGLFPWIVDNYKDKIQVVFVGGDLTDRKDRHADWFVNKVVGHVKMLAEHFQVFILKGNHDYQADPTQPFFMFLNDLPNVRYIEKSRRIHFPINGKTRAVLFLPHTRNPERDWRFDLGHPDMVLLHQTFRGAKSESGRVLEGLNPRPVVRFKCPVFSGDIHVPQKIGPITYIGCPYHIHFGDKFRPRLLLADEKYRTKEIHFPAPQKLTWDVRNAKEILWLRGRLKKGDRLKVRVHLPRSEFVSWVEKRDQIREIVEQLGVELKSITLVEVKEEDKGKKVNKVVTKHRTREDVFRIYCRRNKVPDNLTEIGKELMKG